MFLSLDARAELTVSWKQLFSALVSAVLKMSCLNDVLMKRLRLMPQTNYSSATTAWPFKRKVILHTVKTSNLQAQHEFGVLRWHFMRTIGFK